MSWYSELWMNFLIYDALAFFCIGPEHVARNYVLAKVDDFYLTNL